MKTLEQIGEELQGYDPQALRASDVNAFLANLVEPVTQTETVSIFAALDRVLAQDVVSPISVPRTTTRRWTALPLMARNCAKMHRWH